jgi:4-hydroxy-tetrahydrodipicolinate synthase
MLSGSLVALVTPFKNGELDEAKVGELVEFHLSRGTHGIVPSGTTGESPTLSDDERVRLFKRVRALTKGKIPMIAGCGSNSTSKSIQTVKIAEECGADAALVVTPYYNKPTQEGLYRHYEAIARSTKLPIVLYNVPGRTAVNLLPETVARLAKIPTIVANKEASGSLDQITQILATTKIRIISGDDALTFPILALGGVGVISVAANIIPKEMATMCDAFAAGKLDQARAIHVRYHGLIKALFIETSPIPVKTALKLMGLLNGELRLPLCPMSPSGEVKLAEALMEAGLLGKAGPAKSKTPVKSRK